MPEILKPYRIPTPRKCPCCLAPVAREHAETLSKGAYLRLGDLVRVRRRGGLVVFKRCYLDRDGRPHSCAVASNSSRLQIRKKRHALRDLAREAAAKARAA